MTKNLAIDLIRDSGLAEAERLISLLRPSIRISTLRLDREPSHDASKFGGVPLIPCAFDWPEWNITSRVESQIKSLRQRLPNARSPKHLESMIGKLEEELRRPMRSLDFLAEIKLSDLPVSDPSIALPSTGRLLFFYDVDSSPWGYDPADRGSWNVIYLDEESSLVRHLPSSVSKSSSGFRSCVLNFDVEYTLSMDMRDYNIDLCIWEEGSAYSRLYASLIEERATIHRIGGYAEAVQGSMELECQLVSNGIYCGNSTGYNDPRRKLLEAGAKGWHLLLQIDSDDQVGWMWGDVGRLYFWIRNEDLREGDFSNVWCVQQCH